MAYAGLVLGMWDGLASGFDATRVEVIRHKYANAYALRHMSSSAFEATCYDSRINLTADAKALCGAKRAARGFRQ